ncbi:hypothetical protein ACIAET_04430 [Klebsiella quasipneumoniae subsp. similipneumoniae]|uniref:hypothetical protein n=1 Tax=Klebsiella quasipneumoniae TaxID=1463165 RepID=UPI003D6E6E1F
MKERGMIFNEYQVRALLDGSMTQVRRPITRRQTRATEIAERDDGSKWPWSEDAEHACDFWHPCPFGAVGDRIWVRETFCTVDDTQYGGGKWVDYRATPKFEASHPAGWDCAPNDAEALKWRPSIHMPRWASRILLEITDVRVERLNAISQEDAQAEGMELTGWRPTYSDPDSGGEVLTPYDNFAQLWESIYGEESWKANPWVWVIEFKRVEGGAA